MFIQTVPPEEATGTLKESYDRALSANGYIPTSTRALSLRPEAMAAWAALGRAIRATMDQRRYELITVVAAARLRCTY